MATGGVGKWNPDVTAPFVIHDPSYLKSYGPGGAWSWPVTQPIPPPTSWLGPTPPTPPAPTAPYGGSVPDTPGSRVLLPAPTWGAPPTAPAWGAAPGAPALGMASTAAAFGAAPGAPQYASAALPQARAAAAPAQATPTTAVVNPLHQAIQRQATQGMGSFGYGAQAPPWDPQRRRVPGQGP